MYQIVHYYFESDTHTYTHLYISHFKTFKKAKKNTIAALQPILKKHTNCKHTHTHNYANKKLNKLKIDKIYPVFHLIHKNYNEQKKKKKRLKARKYNVDEHYNVSEYNFRHLCKMYFTSFAPLPL